MGAVTTLTFAWLAYQFHNSPLSKNNSASTLYALAAATSLGIGPYTAIFMNATNSKIIDMERETAGLDIKDQVSEVGLAKGASAKELVDWWGVLNMGRAMVVLTATLLGLTATLGSL